MTDKVRYTVKLDASIIDSVYRSYFAAEFAGFNEDGNLVLHPAGMNERDTEIKSIEVFNLEQKDIDKEKGISSYSANIYTDDDDVVEDISFETLRKWMRPYEYQIYGRSDDLIYVRGAVNKEFSAMSEHVTLKLAFDDDENLKVEVIYNTDGEWVIRSINERQFVQNSSMICELWSERSSAESDMFCSYSDLFCVGSYKPVKDIRKILI